MAVRDPRDDAATGDTVEAAGPPVALKQLDALALAHATTGDVIYATWLARA